MSRIQDAVRRVKNIFTINNVYDCARPILLLFGLAGIGATRIRNSEGVYTLHNTGYTTLMTVLMSLLHAPYLIIQLSYTILFTELSGNLKYLILYIIMFLQLSIVLFAVSAGGIMASVSCKRLERVLQIIHNVDRQLAEVNVRVQHWQITLKLAVLVPVIFHYTSLFNSLKMISETGSNHLLIHSLSIILFDFYFLWPMLFLLIIHERFVCLTKVLQQNATVPTIHIVGGRRRRDSYILRRVQLARHVHEQLTEAVQLFSDSCRYVVVGLLAASMLTILQRAYALLVYHRTSEIYEFFTSALRIVLLTYICQANKNERRVRTGRIRHLLAFETSREIVQQLQQYTMYNAFSTPALLDFQLADINHILLLTIIDVVASNILIIYSYTR